MEVDHCKKNVKKTKNSKTAKIHLSGSLVEMAKSQILMLNVMCL